jgi:hypothetical protein
MKLEKFKVYRLELPVQTVTRKDNGIKGKPVTVTTTEMNGGHRCITVAVDPDGQWAIVVPLTSAQDSQGGEKWSVVKKTWLRLFHDGRPVYALTEQIRYADKGRFFADEGWLGDYDQKQIEAKLRGLLSLN